MYRNLKEQAIERVKLAIKEDVAGNYGKAFPLYMNALEGFKSHLKHEKNPKIREAITRKFMEYLRRAEEIRVILNNPKGHGRECKKNQNQARLVAALHSTLVREKPNVKWSDVAGLGSVKQALQEAVVLPIKFPHFFTGKRRPWSAFLLYGPPGTGKSYLAKAVATESDSTFFSVSSSDLVSKWMGESEKLVSNLFQMARESAPSIIFFDEIDSLCGQRGEGNESEASRRVKTELLIQLQGVGSSNQRVLVLAATNTPYALDQAIRRRFDKKIYIPLPDSMARQYIFKVHLGDTPHSLTEKDLEHLAHRTEGFSGSDISVCVNEVLFEPVRKTKNAKFFIMDGNKMWIPCGANQYGAVAVTMEELDAQGFGSMVLPPPITMADFDKVLNKQKPTLSKADLDVHERFTEEFGDKARVKDPEVCERFTTELNAKEGFFLETEGFGEEGNSAGYKDSGAFDDDGVWFSESKDLLANNRISESAEKIKSARVENTEDFERFTVGFNDKGDYFSGTENMEIQEEFKMVDCFQETEHGTERNTRQIMNVGIAVFVIVSFVHLFMQQI